MNNFDGTDIVGILYGGLNSYKQANTTFFCIDNYFSEV